MGLTANTIYSRQAPAPSSLIAWAAAVAVVGIALSVRQDIN